MVKNRATAEELVQETFLAGLESLHKFRGGSNPRAWLFGILRHKIHDYFRTAFRFGELERPGETYDFEAHLFDEQGAWIEPPAALPRSPDELLQAEQFRKVLESCLEKLPDIQRSVLLMRAFEELPAQQICKELGISSTYLWVLVHRARGGTRQCLEENWLRRTGE